MRKDLYSMKMLMLWLMAVPLLCLGVITHSLAQAPIILSNASEPLVFELPLDASTTQGLSPLTAVQLATRAQHASQGMVYPEWLSDAVFNVNSRPRQRLAIVVSPKRGNPELSTELLLTLNNAGRRSFKPLHLMFDAVGSPLGTPLPEPTVASSQTNPPDSKPDLSVLSSPVIRFEAQPAATQKLERAVATAIPDITEFSVKGAQAPSTALRPRNNTMLQPRPMAAQQKPESAQPPAPIGAASAPTAPAALTLPARAARPIPIPIQQTESTFDKWLGYWPTLAGGLVLFLFLLYVLNRVLKSWRERHTNRTMTTFLEPKPTALAPEESGVNTVFGVSEDEANAMHAKWLQQQISRK